MRDKNEVKEEIASLGKISLWGVKKELKTLYKMLDEDERIMGLVRVFSSATVVLLVATDKRLLILDNHTFYGTDHKEISYLQTTSVDYNTRLFFGKIIIDDQGVKNTFDWAYKNDLRKFVKVLGLKLSEYRERMVERRTGGRKESVADEIEKLWNLVEKGALTKQEYERKKHKLLNR